MVRGRTCKETWGGKWSERLAKKEKVRTIMKQIIKKACCKEGEENTRLKSLEKCILDLLWPLLSWRQMGQCWRGFDVAEISPSPVFSFETSRVWTGNCASTGNRGQWTPITVTPLFSLFPTYPPSSTKGVYSFLKTTFPVRHSATTDINCFN